MSRASRGSLGVMRGKRAGGAGPSAVMSFRSARSSERQVGRIPHGRIEVQKTALRP